MTKQSTNRSTREKQNKKIAESRKTTRNLEKTHHPDPIEIKITDNNPRKCEKLAGMRKQAKYLHNYMLSESRENDTWFGDIDTQTLTTVPVRNPITKEYDDRELGLLGTHVRDAIRDQLIENVKGLSEAKKKGRKVGSLKFENSHGSVGLKQYGVDYYFNENFNRVHITKLGWFSCRGAEVLKDRKIIKSAKLCWRADGVYVIATTWLTPDEWKEARAYEKKKVRKTVQSIDFNVGEPFKDSNDNTFDLVFEEPRALRRARRKLAQQKKGSNGYHKTREKIAFLAQKNMYRKDDAANKVCSYYMRNDMLIIQDDNLNAWKKKDSAAHGSKKIHAGILGRVKAKLVKYPGTVVLDSYVPTTRSCPICGEKTETPLGMATFTCSHCGHTAPRDLHAAWNMDYFARKNGAGEIPLWYQELVISDDVEATLARAVERSAHSESGLRIDSVHKLHDLLGHVDLPKSTGKRKRSKKKVLRGAWVSSRVARGKRDKWSGRSKGWLDIAASRIKGILKEEATKKKTSELIQAHPELNDKEIAQLFWQEKKNGTLPRALRPPKTYEVAKIRAATNKLDGKAWKSQPFFTPKLPLSKADQISEVSRIKGGIVFRINCDGSPRKSEYYYPLPKSERYDTGKICKPDILLVNGVLKLSFSVRHKAPTPFEPQCDVPVDVGVLFPFTACAMSADYRSQVVYPDDEIMREVRKLERLSEQKKNLLRKATDNAREGRSERLRELAVRQLGETGCLAARITRVKNRVADLVAHRVVGMAFSLRGRIVLEELSWATPSHAFFQSLLQENIEGLAVRCGVPVVRVSAAGTSRACPVCGEKLSQGRQVLSPVCVPSSGGVQKSEVLARGVGCSACGYRGHHDGVSVYNMGERSLGCGFPGVFVRLKFKSFCWSGLPSGWRRAPQHKLRPFEFVSQVSACRENSS